MGNKKIGDYLVDEHICDEHAISDALDCQSVLRKKGDYKPLGSILVDAGVVSWKDLNRCLARFHMDRLAGSPLFKELPHEEIETFISSSANQIQRENTVVFNRGGKGDTFFIVISGRVKVYIESADGTENALGILGPGEIFGEIGFFSETPGSASVKTLEVTSLLLVAKKYFEQIVGKNPDFLKGVIKVLADRITNKNDSLTSIAENERAFKQFITTQTEVSYHPLVGQTPAMKKVIKQIQEASLNADPVLLFSEPGTMKTALARAIHDQGPYAKGPFLVMDAMSAGADFLEEPPGDAPENPVYPEIAQYAALFGHEQGVLPSMNTKRLGLLQICLNGTVVIRNIHKLTFNMQERLFEYLNTGLFHTIGKNEAFYSNARIIATTSEDLEKLTGENRFSKRLFERLSAQTISIPPLHRRKKDLREIVQNLIVHSNARLGKNVKDIEPEAYQRIMAYDWPGDMEELEVVIRRAVGIAEGERLMPEDIFIGLAPPEGKHVLNLLNFSAVRNVFTNRFFPVGIQAITAVFFIAIFLTAFLGSQSPEKNVSLILVWAVWWPLIAVSWFVGARVWCCVCPMGAVNDLLNKFCSLKLKVPKFIIENGVYLSAVGLGIIIWVESASTMPYSPAATGVLLLSITTFAILSGLFFERRVWCRYLCPLGRLSAVFAGCSIVELRSNKSICNTTCKTHGCYKGSGNIPGCPLYQGPFSLLSNHNCILCGNCVKVCENTSPVFNFRIPGYDLWAMLKPERLISILAPVIIGTQIFRGFEHSIFYHRMSGWMDNRWLGLAALMAAAVFISYLFVRVSGALFVSALKDRSIKKEDLLNYALIPLAMGFELGYHSGPLLNRVGHIFPVLGKQFGFNLEFLNFTGAMGSPIPWQVLFIFVGCAASVFVLAKLITNHKEPAETGFNWKRGLPIFILAFIYVLLFIFRY